jgi:porphobilinogen synthase
MATFPSARLSRLRKSQNIRNMLSENQLSISDLVYPIFVVAGNNVKLAINSMPGVFRLSADLALELCQKAHALGISSIFLFGLPEYKDEQGTSAYDHNEPVQKAIRLIKQALPDMTIITDVCLCQYTTHGHCGVLTDNKIDHDQTLEIIEKVALSHAQAGSDIVAPSGMIDGQVLAIRKALDAANYTDILVMPYSAKYASAFYGPFREAADCAPRGDRKSYQMNPANSTEALNEIATDIEEGADILIIKPAMAFLDIIRQAKDRFLIPIAAYNVSGEYALIKAASAQGWIDEKKVVLETLLGMKRAGANIIITYHALDVATWLKD